MYHFIACFLNQRPDANLVRKLRTSGIETFLHILEVEQAGPELEEGLAQMVAYIQNTDGQSEAQVVQELAVDWTRLFRGVQPGYGPPPPYETEYRGGAYDPSQALQRLMYEYAAAGARIDARAGNRPDYLGLELAFLSFLASREAEACQAGDPFQAEEFARAAQIFICRHPGAWVDSFCEKAITEARTAFYRGYLLVLKSVLHE